MKSEKGLAPILILVGILVVIGIATGAYYFGKSQVSQPQPQNQAVVAQTPQPSSPDSIGANWKTYTNGTYKFSFDYPSDWTVKEENDNCVVSVTNANFDQLSVCVKYASDTTTIVRSGVGAGEIVKRGTVQFFDQPVEKNVLVFEGEDKSVLYANAGEIPIRNLVFTVSLDHYQPGSAEYRGVDVSSETISDQILSTFKFLP